MLDKDGNIDGWWTVPVSDLLPGRADAEMYEKGKVLKPELLIYYILP